jgi:ribosome-associated translation inhibitor RaiA
MRGNETRGGGHGEHAAAAGVRIDVTGAGMLITKARRERVRRRVLLAMSRFDHHVVAVRARLGRSRTSLGGVDVRCRVGARLRSGLRLEAEAIDGQVEAAVGRCSTRLALLVGAALDGDAPRPRHAGRR